MAWVLLQLENEGQDKRVESVWFPCLDEGSTPSSSTNVTPSRGLTLVRVLSFASLDESGKAERDSLQLHEVLPHIADYQLVGDIFFILVSGAISASIPFRSSSSATVLSAV